MENYSNPHSLKRRSFLGNIIKASFIGIIPSSISFGSPLKEVKIRNAENRLFLTKPYVQNISTDQVTIMWITSVPCKSWVTCTDSSGNTTIHTATHAGLIDAYNYINKITINDLDPGKDYTYKAVSEEILVFKPYSIEWGITEQSDQFKFSTVDKNTDKVSCIIFNDIHDRPESFLQLFNLVKDIPFDFAVLNGDMFDYETDQAQIIQHLLQPLSSLFSTDRPFCFQRGNHETRGKFARNHFDYVFDNPGYFSFVQGPVHFTFLDTGEDKEDDHKEYNGMVSFDSYRSGQAQWMKRIIEQKNFKYARFRIVFMHIPPFYSGEGHGTKHCRELFVPLFNTGKVDLVISGHTHVYGVHPATKEHHFPIVIGGGPLVNKRTIISFNVNNRDLSLKMLKDDGSIVGQLDVKAK